MCMPSQEQRPAATQPPKMAGRIFLRFSFPFFKRRTQTPPAAARKNRRLTERAVSASMLTTRVSHRISREPPPIPKPARKPSSNPMSRDNRGVSINNGYPPIKSISPNSGEATSPVFFCLKGRQKYRPERRLAYKARHPAMAGDRVRD